MKEHPILFKGEMVQSILSGRKTQTRRLIKLAKMHSDFGEPNIDGFWIDTSYLKPKFGGVPCVKIPYGSGDNETTQRHFPKWAKRDRLWVKETFAPNTEINTGTIYRADRGGDYQGQAQGDFKWKPSIFMPRVRCRITLEVTGLRAERLLDISESDAISEGIEPVRHLWRDYLWPEALALTACSSYFSLWDSINGKGSSKTNPLVWVIEFKRI